MFSKNSISKLYPILALLLIVAFGFSIRLFKITQAPKGALIDELHFGYLAYSLIETGMDEHGISYPVIFKGFGDEKLPAYAYVSIPFVKAFGLEVLAFRLPSLLMGTALIIAMYWLVIEIGLEKRWALFAAFITSISPWPFFLSRIGFESNLALGFYGFALASLLRGINKKSTPFTLLSGVLFGLTWYSYIAYRPVTIGLLAVLAVFVFYKKLLERKQLLGLFLVFALTIAPLFSPSVVAVNNTRLKQVGIFSEPGIVLNVDEKRTFCDMQLPRKVCDVAFNKYVEVGRTLADRMLETYSPNYLATEGEADIIFLTVKNYGQFYSILYPFFLLGLAGLFLLKKNNKVTDAARVIIIAGLILAPIPTIMVGDPQKVRISSLMPFIIVLMTIGMAFASQLLKKKILQDLLLFSVVLAVFIQSYFYFVEYFTVHTVQNEYHYQSYLPDMYEYINSLDESTEVTIRPFFSDPLMFYAFYSKMDPSEYQKLAILGEREDSGFQHTIELGRVKAYEHSVSHVGCEAHKNGTKAVFVTNEEIQGANILYEGKSTNGVYTHVYVYDANSSVDVEKCDFSRF